MALTQDVEAGGLPDNQPVQGPSLAWVIVPGVLAGPASLLGAAWADYHAKQLGVPRAKYWVWAAVFSIVMPILLSLLMIAALAGLNHAVDQTGAANPAGTPANGPANAPASQSSSDSVVRSSPANAGLDQLPTESATDSPQTIVDNVFKIIGLAACTGNHQLIDHAVGSDSIAHDEWDLLTGTQPGNCVFAHTFIEGRTLGGLAEPAMQATVRFKRIGTTETADNTLQFAFDHGEWKLGNW